MTCVSCKSVMLLVRDGFLWKASMVMVTTTWITPSSKQLVTGHHKATSHRHRLLQSNKSQVTTMQLDNRSQVATEQLVAGHYKATGHRSLQSNYSQVTTKQLAIGHYKATSHMSLQSVKLAVSSRAEWCKPSTKAYLQLSCISQGLLLATDWTPKCVCVCVGGVQTPNLSWRKTKKRKKLFTWNNFSLT